MIAHTLNDALGILAALEGAAAEIAREAAPALAALIEQSFASGIDPYGNAWAPLAKSTVKRGRRPPPLTDTHATRDSAQVRAFGPTIVATVQGAADWHQPDRQRRQILPTDAQGLPPSWEGAIEDAAAAFEQRVAA